MIQAYGGELKTEKAGKGPSAVGRDTALARSLSAANLG